MQFSKLFSPFLALLLVTQISHFASADEGNLNKFVPLPISGVKARSLPYVNVNNEGIINFVKKTNNLPTSAGFVPYVDAFQKPLSPLYTAPTIPVDVRIPLGDLNNYYVKFTDRSYSIFKASDHSLVVDVHGEPGLVEEVFVPGTNPTIFYPKSETQEIPLYKLVVSDPHDMSGPYLNLATFHLNVNLLKSGSTVISTKNESKVYTDPIKDLRYELGLTLKLVKASVFSPSSSYQFWEILHTSTSETNTRQTSHSLGLKTSMYFKKGPVKVQVDISSSMSWMSQTAQTFGKSTEVQQEIKIANSSDSKPLAWGIYQAYNSLRIKTIGVDPFEDITKTLLKKDTNLAMSIGSSSFTEDTGAQLGTTFPLLLGSSEGNATPTYYTFTTHLESASY